MKFAPTQKFFPVGHTKINNYFYTKNIMYTLIKVTIIYMYYFGVFQECCI